MADERDDWIKWGLRGLVAFVLWVGWSTHENLVRLSAKVESLEAKQSAQGESISKLWEKKASKPGTNQGAQP